MKLTPRVNAPPSHIHSWVHVARARGNHGTSAVTFSFHLNSRLMYLSLLVGRYGSYFAIRFRLPRREFIVAAENDIVIGSQVSKPCTSRDSCSSVGTYRCHSTLLSFPFLAS